MKLAFDVMRLLVSTPPGWSMPFIAVLVAAALVSWEYLQLAPRLHLPSVKSRQYSTVAGFASGLALDMRFMQT